MKPPSTLPPWLWDVAAVLGVLLVAAGLWCIWPPLALLVGGLGLAGLGVGGSWYQARLASQEREAERKRRPPLSSV